MLWTVHNFHCRSLSWYASVTEIPLLHGVERKTMSASHGLMGLARTGCSESAGHLRLSIFCYQVSHEQQPHSLKQCVFGDLHCAFWGCAFRLCLSCADAWTEPSTAQLGLSSTATGQSDLENKPGFSVPAPWLTEKTHQKQGGIADQAGGAAAHFRWGTHLRAPAIFSWWSWMLFTHNFISLSFQISQYPLTFCVL